MLAALKAIAQEAGAMIMSSYEKGDFTTYEKPDDSPVTSADITASQLIAERLQQQFPTIPVLSEESTHESFKQRQQWTRYFLIDPIDGTQEFISRSGDFAVNIALIDRNEPILGVIYWPAGDALYSAQKGAGGYKETVSGRERLAVRRLDKPQTDPIVIAISRRQPRQPVLDRIQTERELQPLPAGSCSLKACFIAEGKADCFLRLGPTGEWDTAASQVIVSEAGGSLLNENFEPITYNRTVSLMNPNFLVLGDPAVDWRQIFIAHPPQYR